MRFNGEWGVGSGEWGEEERVQGAGGRGEEERLLSKGLPNKKTLNHLTQKISQILLTLCPLCLCGSHIIFAQNFSNILLETNNPSSHSALNYTDVTYRVCGFRNKRSDRSITSLIN